MRSTDPRSRNIIYKWNGQTSNKYRSFRLDVLHRKSIGIKALLGWNKDKGVKFTL